MKVTKPKRTRHQYTQSLAAPPERVFPLLCPVRETDWAPGWSPKLVIAESGLMEKHCLFVTPEEDHDAEAVWINGHYDAQTFSLELWKVVPDHTVCHFDIRLTAENEARTAAVIAYTCTSLGPSGEEFLEGFTGEWYVSFMQHWEEALNYYLEHETMISTLEEI